MTLLDAIATRAGVADMSLGGSWSGTPDRTFDRIRLRRLDEIVKTSALPNEGVSRGLRERMTCASASRRFFFDIVSAARAAAPLAAARAHRRGATGRSIATTSPEFFDSHSPRRGAHFQHRHRSPPSFAVAGSSPSRASRGLSTRAMASAPPNPCLLYTSDAADE